MPHQAATQLCGGQHAFYFLRQFDENKVAHVVEVILAAFVHDPDEPRGSHLRGHRNLRVQPLGRLLILANGESDRGRCAIAPGSTPDFLARGRRIHPRGPQDAPKSGERVREREGGSSRPPAPAPLTYHSIMVDSRLWEQSNFLS